MITIYTGPAGSCKTVHAYSVVLDNQRRGREVFTNIRQPLDDLFSVVPGELQAQLNSHRASEFYRHIKPSSFVVIDEFDSLISEIDREAFFDIWFRQHLFAGTDLILIGQNLTRIASFFHHAAADSAIHKSVNPDFVFEFARFSIPFIGKFYSMSSYAVDTSFLKDGLESQNRKFALSFRCVSRFPLFQTINRIVSFKAKS